MANTSALSLLSGYVPNIYVKYGQIMPRESNSLLKLTGLKTTTTTQFTLSTAYYLTLVGVPAALFLLAIISMVFLNLGLATRFCLRWMACYPRKMSGARKRRRQRLFSAAIVFFCLLLLVSVALLYLASGNLDAGVTAAQPALASLMSRLQHLSDDLREVSQLLGTTGNSTSAARSAAANPNLGPDQNNLAARIATARAECTPTAAPTLDLLTHLSTTLGSNTKLVARLVSVVQLETATVSQYLTKYLATNARKYATYVLGAIPALLSISFYLLLYKESSRGLKLVSAVSVVYFYLLVLAGLPASLLVSLLADFCQKPFANILSVAGPPDSTLYNVTHFYTTCTGLNVATGHLSTAALSASAMRKAVGGAKASCTGSALGLTAFRGLNKTTELLGRNVTQSLLDVPDCGAFRAIYVELVDSSLCQGMYPGLLELALALLLSSFSLWMCVVLSSLVWPHFDPEFRQQQVVPGKDGEDGEDDEGSDEDDEYDDGDGDDDDDDDGGEERKAGEAVLRSSPTATTTDPENPKVVTFDWSLLEEEISKGQDNDSVSSDLRSIGGRLMKKRDGGPGDRYSNPFDAFDEDDDQDDDVERERGKERVRERERERDDGYSMDISQITQAVTQEEYVHALAINDPGREDES